MWATQNITSNATDSLMSKTRSGITTTSKVNRIMPKVSHHALSQLPGCCTFWKHAEHLLWAWGAKTESETAVWILGLRAWFATRVRTRASSFSPSSASQKARGRNHISRLVLATLASEQPANFTARPTLGILVPSLYRFLRRAKSFKMHVPNLTCQCIISIIPSTKKEQQHNFRFKFYDLCCEGVAVSKRFLELRLGNLPNKHLAPFGHQPVGRVNWEPQ